MEPVVGPNKDVAGRNQQMLERVALFNGHLTRKSVVSPSHGFTVVFNRGQRRRNQSMTSSFAQILGKKSEYPCISEFIR